MSNQKQKVNKKKLKIYQPQWKKQEQDPLPQHIKKPYLQALKYSNLKLKQQINYKNVRIYESDHIHQLYNITNKNLPHIVLLHGYGGTSLTFIRLFEFLTSYYQIHAIDTFGIGLSSRGNYRENMTVYQTQLYFTEAIQCWRKNSQIQSFTLLGHSFGGYIAALYNHFYPSRVQRLILLSPAGTSSNREEIENQLEKRKTSLRSRLFIWAAQKVYNLNLRPTKVMSSCLVGDRFVESVVDKRLNLKQQQRQVWKQYLKGLGKFKSSSQSGFYKLFQWPIIAHTGIEQMIGKQEKTTAIQFYFGQYDWMDKNAAIRMQQSSIKNMIIVSIVPNSGHQLTFDNPQGIAAKIIQRYKIFHGQNDNLEK